MKLPSVHEVYFLVRTGTWGEEDLDNWLQASIDAHWDEEDYDIEDDPDWAE